jgi:hypothetical protein
VALGGPCYQSGTVWLNLSVLSIQIIFVLLRALCSPLTLQWSLALRRQELETTMMLYLQHLDQHLPPISILVHD